LWYYITFPAVPGTDAWFYLSVARYFQEKGVLAGLEDLRTYGYPFSLYLLTFLAPLGRSIEFGARIAQLMAYGVVVCWFAARIARDGAPKLGAALAAGLLLNPFLAALVGDMLTEAPTLILTVFTLLCLYNSARARTAVIVLAWGSAGALAANFALMVRPTNLTLVIAWNIGIAVSLLAPRPINRAHVAAGYVGAWVATAAMAWAPQVIHNLSLGHVGVMPASNLFREQVLLGIMFMRYDSIVDRGGNADGLFVPNPWCVDPWPSLTWYLEHPLNGLGTIGGHLASAFSLNHLFTYVYDWNAPYSLSLAVLTWAVVALGAWQGVRLLLCCRLTTPPERAALATAVVALFGLGVGVLAFVLVESRFASVPLAILSVLAVHLILTCRRVPREAFVFAVVVAALGASFADRQRRGAFEWPERGQLTEYRCFIARNRHEAPASPSRDSPAIQPGMS
jgi:hypothetical protein